MRSGLGMDYIKQSQTKMSQSSAMWFAKNHAYSVVSSIILIDDHLFKEMIICDHILENHTFGHMKICGMLN